MSGVNHYVVELSNHRVTRTTFIVICCALMVALVCMLHNVVPVAVAGGFAAGGDRQVTRRHDCRDAACAGHVLHHVQHEPADDQEHPRATGRGQAGKWWRRPGQARMEATLNVQRLARELKQEQQRQREVQDTVSRQLADAHLATANVAAVADARIADVKTEMGTVKHEVAQTRSNLNKAVSELRRVVGDMGVMSGLIATNQKELETLRALGDRSYTEFRLTRAKDAQVVNGVALQLKRTDPSKRRFTLEVTANDVRVQKARSHGERAGAVLCFLAPAAVRDRGERHRQG